MELTFSEISINSKNGVGKSIIFPNLVNANVRKITLFNLVSVSLYLLGVLLWQLNSLLVIIDINISPLLPLNLGNLSIFVVGSSIPSIRA